MLLQLALDAPAHLAVVEDLRDVVDIVEIGTPLLKRFGLSAISTVREIAPNVPVLADTKTVDGGKFEAEMVFAAGATFMTVLSCAPEATHTAVGEVAADLGGWAVLDTITDSGQDPLIPQGLMLPDAFAYVAVHSPTDVRLAGDASTAHIDAVRQVHQTGRRVSLAGGISLATFDAVLAAAPEIVVVGGAITAAPSPREVAQWMHEKLSDSGRGWPWDAK